MKNSPWRWAKSVTCFPKLDDRNWISFYVLHAWEFKIADDVLDCKDALPYEQYLLQKF